MILEWATFPVGLAVGQSIAHRRAGAHTHRGHQGGHLGTRRRAHGRTRGRALICLLVSEGLFFFLAGYHAQVNAYGQARAGVITHRLSRTG